MKWAREQLAAHIAKNTGAKLDMPKGSAGMKKPVIPETHVQQLFVKRFAFDYPEIYKTGALIAIPNEGKRSKATASRMKAEGMWAGASDLILFVPRGIYHGAVIEMKAEDGIVKSNQSEWQEERKISGYAAAVCWSDDEAMEFVDWYLNLK